MTRRGTYQLRQPIVSPPRCRHELERIQKSLFLANIYPLPCQHEWLQTCYIPYDQQHCCKLNFISILYIILLIFTQPLSLSTSTNLPSIQQQVASDYYWGRNGNK